jgi:hypothetical protein
MMSEKTSWCVWYRQFVELLGRVNIATFGINVHVVDSPGKVKVCYTVGLALFSCATSTDIRSLFQSKCAYVL